MRVQAFVPDWPGVKQHGRETACILRDFCDTAILDNPSHYFSQQWELARSIFDGDIFLWVMADVWPPDNMAELFKRMTRLMAGNIGVYAPQVRFNGWQYPLDKLTKVEEDVYEVPNAEMLFLAVRSDVLAELPHVDWKKNWIGTGIDLAVRSSAKRLGLKTVRDYRFTAAHEPGTGYDQHQTGAHMEAYLASMAPEKAQAILDTMYEAQAILCTDFSPFKISQEELNQFRERYEKKYGK